MIDAVRIPKMRMKKLLPVKGELEELTGVKIEVNDEVRIESDDAIKVMRAKQMIRAFGRGFDIEAVKDLLDDEYMFEDVNIKEYAGKSRKRLITLRGRVIGTKGRTKRLIEELAGVKIAIYGKTVGIIGKWDRVQLAKQAVDMLLSGSMHNTVYKFLERKK